MSEQRCYATTDRGDGRAFCILPAHPSHKMHHDQTGWWWLDASGFENLANGGPSVVEDRTPGERSLELLAGDQIVAGTSRPRLPRAESADADSGVSDAVEQLVAAVRAESARELADLRSENVRLQKLILDAGSVITAAIGSIGEPREWSVKQKYQQTYLGPKRARQWQRIREADVNGDTTNAERVAHFLGVTHEAAGSLLRDAEREGKAERVSRGRYKVAR